MPHGKRLVKVAFVIAMAGAAYSLLRQATADGAIGPARR
jgi:hypothetical protein